MATSQIADTLLPGRPPFRRYRWPRRVIALFTIASTIAALLCFLSYQGDCRRLGGIATAAVADTHTPAERVIALLHWVHGNQSTKENRRYFVIPRLRATPRQVLETGGDCADKSRLLSAMLREVGIPASMAMCFDPLSGNPTHTVVVATIAPGATMVVDPVYDLFFPKPQPGLYYGFLDLRADATLLSTRLDRLRAELPRSHPIHCYNAQSAGYSQASCINWEKNYLTRAVRNWLTRNSVVDIHAIHRPLVIEEPRLLVGVSSLCVAAFGAALFIIVGWLPRRRSRVRERSLPGGTGIIPNGVVTGTYPCGR